MLVGSCPSTFLSMLVTTSEKRGRGHVRKVMSLGHRLISHLLVLRAAARPLCSPKAHLQPARLLIKLSETPPPHAAPPACCACFRAESGGRACERAGAAATRAGVLRSAAACQAVTVAAGGACVMPRSAAGAARPLEGRAALKPPVGAARPRLRPCCIPSSTRRAPLRRQTHRSLCSW